MRLNTNSMNVSQLKAEISKYLPIIDNQMERIVQLIGGVKGLRGYFDTYPKDLSESCQQHLNIAERALDYARPYRIAIIGRTGVGKSAFANALLGRDLLFTKSAGNAATGTVLEVYQTADSADKEQATVHYRSDDDILDLVRYIVTPFNVAPSFSEGICRAPDADAVDKIAESIKGSGDAFLEMKKRIVNIVKQHILHGKNMQNNPGKFDLADLSQQRALNQLIDDDSTENREDTNQIGLVKKIVYRIYPKQDENRTALQLPTNTCLIDLPGIGSPTELHDIIIKNDAREADAVVFIFNTERIKQGGDVEIMKSLRGNIGINNPEQIFIILNKWDRASESDKKGSEIDRIVTGIAEDLSPDKAKLPDRMDGKPYFKTCAYAACLANKTGAESLKDGDSEEYHKFLQNLEVETPEDLLQKSGIPKVVEELNALTAHNVDVRLRVALNNLRSVLRQLINDQGTGEFKAPEETQIKVKFTDSLTKIQQDLKLVVNEFRPGQMRAERREVLKTQLQKTSEEICNSVDKEFASKKFNDLWLGALREVRDSMTGEVGYTLDPLTFVSGINVEICHLLSERLGPLASDIAGHYRKAFEEEKVQENVIRVTFDIPGSENLFSKEKIEEIVDNLEKKLKQTSERIVASHLYTPGYYFWQKPEADSQEPVESSEESAQSDEDPDIRQKWDDLESSLSKESPQSVANTVKGVIGKLQDLLNPYVGNSRDLIGKEVVTSGAGFFARKEPLDKATIDKILKAVREYYFPFVSGRAIEGLLNVYNYEMFLAEKSMLDSINTWNVEAIRLDTKIISDLKIPDLVQLNAQWEEAALGQKKHDYLIRLRDLVMNSDAEKLFEFLREPKGM